MTSLFLSSFRLLWVVKQIGCVDIACGSSSNSYLFIPVKHCYPRSSYFDIMAVAMHCAICNVPGMVFPCARCGGLCCGRCVCGNMVARLMITLRRKRGTGTLTTWRRGCTSFLFVLHRRKLVTPRPTRRRRPSMMSQLDVVVEKRCGRC